MAFEFEHFLVLDDDPAVSEILQGTLKMTVFGFSNVAAFQMHANDLHPKAVFVDVHVGTNDDGLAMIDTVKKNWPKVPIIVVTADREHSLYEKAIGMGAHDFLYKPLKPQEVRHTYRTQMLKSQLA